MKPKVYIDGREGTTGLQIYERLQARSEIELLLIDSDKRKDPVERARLMDAADIVFFCLPDAAAKEALTLIRSDSTRVIDASTAHRTAPGWVYGFAELKKGQRESIAKAKRVANPGCHATGMIACTAPLVQCGLVPQDYPVTVYSLTGYSGGGKKMIAEYEGENVPENYHAPRIYGLSLQHKPLPEMQYYSALRYPPVFNPIVDDYYKGMATTILLQNRLLKGEPTASDVCAVLQKHYEGQALVRVRDFGTQPGMLSGNDLAGTDLLLITVCGNAEQTMVTAQFDNLGKGASGAAVQNMNLCLGLPETAGLHADWSEVSC